MAETGLDSLQIAVRSLVETSLRSGDLSLERWGTISPLEAIRAHQKVQASRPEGYRPEVPVSLTLERTGLTIVVEGRIDGVFDFEDWALIEEIKTTRTNINPGLEVDHPLHWAQAKVYSHMYLLTKGLKRVETRLVYCDVDTGKVREIQRTYSPEHLADFFTQLIDRFLADRDKLDQWVSLRNESARQLQFPFEDFRPGQRELAIEAFRAFRDGRQVLVEAPTGIGKTIAATFPAVKAMGEGFLGGFLYLTAKSTGQAAVEKALFQLRRSGLHLRSLQLTAKEKICFNPEAACDARECPFAAGYYDRVQTAIDSLLAQEHISREAVETAARRNSVCPFELSLDLSPVVDLVIGDYNYAFDPATALRRVVVDARRPFSLIVDEAHNLVDRSREIFSASLTRESVLATRELLKRNPRDLGRALSRIANWMKRTGEKCNEAGGLVTSVDPPTDLFPHLSRFTRLAESTLRLFPLHEKAKREALLTLYFDTLRFTRTGEGFDSTYATIMEAQGSNLLLKLFCMDPAPRLKPLLERAHATVFISATLAPADYFRRVLGLSEGATTLTVTSPFPESNRKVIILDGISTLYQKRAESIDLLTEALGVYVRQRRGNYLIFLPSYEYLSMVYRKFCVGADDLDLLVQEPGMIEESRSFFLDSFSETRSRTLVGFAVMGGVFGEAIDLVGNRLTGAAIVGVGLPGISTERELLRSYFANEFGRGFEYAYSYPGMSRVLQAAGRVIRSETDRGTILLVDERFLRSCYKSLLPRQWKLARVRLPQELKAVLAQFWNTEA